MTESVGRHLVSLRSGSLYGHSVADDPAVPDQIARSNRLLQRTALRAAVEQYRR